MTPGRFVAPNAGAGPAAPERKRGRSVRVRLALWAVAALVFFMAPAERAAAQTVTIPDANLRAALETALGKTAGEAITRAEMSGLVIFTANNAGIRTLTGLEHATNLQVLTLESNEISDLTPLAGLRQLATLGLYENRIEDLTPLAGLPYLSSLRLGLNRISDLTPLAGLTSLTSLELHENRISDVTPLAGLVNLKRLPLQENRITDLAPLARLTSLTHLFLHYNRIADITPLRGMTALINLNLGYNERLEDLSAVEGMTALQRLSLDGSGVRDLAPLVANTGLGSGDTIDLRDARNLNADAARTTEHVTTLRNRGVNALVNSPLGLDRVVRGVLVTPGVERLTVTWNPLATEAGFNPTGYRVQWKSGAQAFTIRATPPRHEHVTGLGTTRHVLTGLTPGVEYTVQVRAHGAYGPPSARATGTPWAAVRVGEPGGDPDVTVTPGVKSLTVSWKAVDGAADYKVQWRRSDEEDYDPVARQKTAGGPDRTRVTIPDLTPGVEYTVRVIATTDTGAEGPPSDEATGIPLRPDFSVHGVDVVGELRSLVVTWRAVPRADSYRVQWRRTDTDAEEFDAADAACLYVREQEACVAVPHSGPAGSGEMVTWTITGLEPDVEYQVVVTPMLGDQPLGDPRDGTGRPLGKVVVTIMGAVAGVGNVAVVEGDEAELLVMLDKPSRARVTVAWRTEDDDTAPAATRAKAGEDYLATSGRLTIQPDAVEAVLRVATLGDRRVEPSETFRVRLTEATTYAEPDPEAASATVTITDDDTEPARGRALGKVLAGMGRWIAADAVEVIGGRFTGREAEVGLGGRTLPLPGIGPREPAWSAGPGREDEWAPEKDAAHPALSAETLARSRFNLPLGRREAGGGPPGLRVWGQGSAGGFEGRPEAGFRVDGEVVGGYLGFDYRPRPDALVGVAMARSRGDVDYEIDEVTTGEVDLDLTSVLPYAHWSPRADLEIWGLLGAGWGDAELEDEAGEVEAGLEMRMAALGLRREVAAWREVDVALKTDAFLAGLKTDAEAGLPKAEGKARRLRLRLEGRMQQATSPVSQLAPSLEIGGRWDGGDAETGMGLEVGGGLAYVHETLGLEVEARGRYLLAHRESSFDEWGGSLAAKLDPGLAGRGPWMTFAPGWGAEGSRVAQMWEGKEAFRAPGGGGEGPELSPDRVDLEVGWGAWRRVGGAGLVTPWAGLSMAGSVDTDYKLGARMEAGSGMSLDLENRLSEAAGYEVMLYGRVDW